MGVTVPKPCPKKRHPARSSSRDEGLDGNPRYVQDPPVENSHIFPCGQAVPGIMVLNIFLLKDSKCQVPCSHVRPFWRRVPPFCVCVTLKTFGHVERGQQKGGGGEFRGRGAYGGVYKMSFALRAQRYIRA